MSTGHLQTEINELVDIITTAKTTNVGIHPRTERALVDVIQRARVHLWAQRAEIKRTLKKLHYLEFELIDLAHDIGRSNREVAS